MAKKSFVDQFKLLDPNYYLPELVKATQKFLRSKGCKIKQSDRHPADIHEAVKKAFGGKPAKEVQMAADLLWRIFEALEVPERMGAVMHGMRIGALLCKLDLLPSVELAEKFGPKRIPEDLKNRIVELREEQKCTYGQIPGRLFAEGWKDKAGEKFTKGKITMIYRRAKNLA